MKTFKEYIVEAPVWQQSTSKMVFGWTSFDYVMLPLSSSMLSRTMKQNRDRVFHVLGEDDIGNLIKLQGKKKSIAAFYRRWCAVRWSYCCRVGRKSSLFW